MNYVPRGHSQSFFQTLPVLSQSHLLSSGLLWVSDCVTRTWPQTSIATGQLPGRPTTTPKALKSLKEFEGEDDCDERQMEKDGGEVRRIRAKSMAAPPRIIET